MSSEGSAAATNQPAGAADTPVKTGNPLRRIAVAVLVVTCLLYALSVLMERRTPASSQATLNVYIIGIAPEVTGRVIEVGVADNSTVTTGQMLFRIDPRQYELAVEEAEARLAGVGQSIGASTATVDAVQARLIEAKAIRDNVKEQANRAMELVERGIYAQAKQDQAIAALDQANAAVQAAEAELKKAQEELGPAGVDNPQLRESLAALERARLDLHRTTVSAPAEGAVTNLQLSVGSMVAAGKGAMTFVDMGSVWITAAFKENSLGSVAAGNRAEVLFDILPGKIFAAKVESVGMAVAQGNIDPNTGLPKISTDSGWVRTPQSFPVRLILDEGRPKGVGYGSQADVVIYTGDNTITNALGSMWMRVLSVLSYVR